MIGGAGCRLCRRLGKPLLDTHNIKTCPNRNTKEGIEMLKKIEEKDKKKNLNKVKKKGDISKPEKTPKKKVKSPVAPAPEPAPAPAPEPKTEPEPEPVIELTPKPEPEPKPKTKKKIKVKSPNKPEPEPKPKTKKKKKVKSPDPKPKTKKKKKVKSPDKPGPTSNPGKKSTIDIKGRNVFDFIKTEIKTYNKLKDILDKFDPEDEIDDKGNILLRSARGFVYERIWDLCIKFGIVNILTLPSIDKKLQTSHIFGNANTETFSFNNNCWSGNILNKYLEEKIQSGNSGGYSDITFLNKKIKDNEEDIEDLYFISVKFYEKSKSVDKYDIGKLCTLIEKHQKSKRNINILIFVKDKKSLIKKFNRQHRSSDIMMKYINPGGKYENIYDENDLEEYYYKLKKLFELYDYFETPENIKDFDKGYLYNLKSPFIPRFHQKLFIDKINVLLDEGNKKILVGAIPRSGKSYIMAGSILDIVKRHSGSKKFNFLLITPAPNETFGEYLDIFQNYIDFDNNNINIITLDSDGRKLKKDKDLTKHNVFIVSKQLLGWGGVSKNEDDDIHEEEKKEKQPEFKNINKYLKGIDFDLIYLDEAHFGMSTERSKSILDSIDKEFKSSTPKIFVTATYNKPLKVFGVTEECKLTWDINDIEIMKKEDINNNLIRDRFGEELYDNAITYFNNDIEKIKHSYSYYPKPYLMTSIWDYNYLHQEKGKLDEGDYGFDMKKVFANDGSFFTNVEQIKNMFHYFFGIPDKNLKYSEQHIYRQRGILPRIRKICNNDCRTMQSPLHKTSQLWFLPYGIKMKISDTVNCLINLFMEDPKFKDIKDDYHFYIAVDMKGKGIGDNDNITIMKNPHTIKKEILEVERELNEGKKNGNNLIILAGARLQLGISLKNVDIVVLWNTIMSSDANFQMLFRSMTEVDLPPCEKDTYCNKKKYGFMVDLNPQRALTNTLLFGENLSSKKSGENKFKLISDLVNIDEDVFHDKYKTDNDLDRGKFVESLFNKLYSSWDKDVEDIRILTNRTIKYDETILKDIEDNLRKIKLSKKNTPERIDDDDEAMEFNPGKKVEKKMTKKEAKEEQKVKEIPLKELASELLSELISLLNIFSLYVKGSEFQCILTDNLDKEELEDRIDNNNIKILNDINVLKTIIFSNPDEKNTFLQILNARLGGNKDEEMDEKIIDVLMNSLTSNSDNLLSINKLIMAQKKKYYTIREPDKLLEYINNNVTPKEKEKKEAGEVFTPINSVKEMLDKLPKKVWSDHTLKWLDPAVGIGNFPIIAYLHLMEGLKSWEPNEEKRRKHIIEKMLYMVEISKKSIIILNKIFCGDKYKLNIFPKSFFDYTETGFDIIMGNPPYNPPKKEGKSTGNSIWQHFVMKSFYMLKEKGYLVFIHPPGWKKPTNDIFKEEVFLKHKDQVKMQVRQGQVWQVLKEKGNYSFIYTNDQKSKSVEYINHFPAVDFYVYQKGGKRTKCDTKNIFNGQIIESKDVDINYDLSFLPNLLTKESLQIFSKVLNKNDSKLTFKRGPDPRNGFKSEMKSGKYRYLYTLNRKMEKQYQYSNKYSDLIDKDKFIINELGGIDVYYTELIKKNDKLGIFDKIFYVIPENIKSSIKYKNIFNSDLIKFIFTITQYMSGARTMNEIHVANSISIPEGDISDIYKYYGINPQEQKLIDVVVNDKKHKSEPVKESDPEDEPAPQPADEPEYEPTPEKGQKPKKTKKKSKRRKTIRKSKRFKRKKKKTLRKKRR